MKYSFRQGRAFTLLLLLSVPLLGIVASSVISSTAKAAVSGYVFVYDSRKASSIKKEIQNTSSVNLGSLANTPNLNTTLVRAAGGELNSGDKTTDLKFATAKVNGAYLFKTKLTCTISGSAIKTYVDIQMPLDASFANKKSYSAKQTVISYLTDSNYNEDTGVTTRLPDGDGYGKEQSSGCFLQSTTSEPKSITIKNFQKLSSGEKDDWRDAVSNTTDRGELSPGATSEGDIPCIGGAMGWIFCPLINYMADGIVAVSGFIDDMMQFKLLIGAQSGNGIRDTLNNFAGIANIMLVIAFLVIIFSQSTSIGLSNYNIKKMLPRIVIAAILINLSFYICAFAIDISNIAGNSIMGLISGQGVGNASVGQGIQSTTGLSGPNGAQKVFGAALGLVTGVILLIMFMGPLLLGIFLTFVILVARQVILLFLVITAPIAFAAWLLPNTESYFKKWKDLFINMLMIYPIIMLIFGVSLFAAKFISDPSIQNSSNSGALGGAAIGPIIVLLILAIPLLALPFILKQSSSMLAKIGSAAQKYGGGQTSGMIGGGVKKIPRIRDGFEMMEQRKAVREQAYGRNKAKRGANRVSGTLSGRVISGVIPTETSRTAREVMAGQAASQLAGLKKQEIDNAKDAYQGRPEYMAGGSTRDNFLQRSFAAARTNEERAALADLAMQGGAPGRSMVKDFASQLPSGSTEAQALAAHLGKEHYPTIESGIPEITDFINTAGAVAPGTTGKDTYKKVTAENIGKLDAEVDPTKSPKSLNLALSTQGAVSDATIQDALSERYRGTIPEGSRNILTTEAARRGISIGNTPPPSGSSGSGGWTRGGSSTGSSSGGTKWTPRS